MTWLVGVIGFLACLFGKERCRMERRERQENLLVWGMITIVVAFVGTFIALIVLGDSHCVERCARDELPPHRWVCTTIFLSAEADVPVWLNASEK